MTTPRFFSWNHQAIALHAAPGPTLRRPEQAEAVERRHGMKRQQAEAEQPDRDGEQELGAVRTAELTPQDVGGTQEDQRFRVQQCEAQEDQLRGDHGNHRPGREDGGGAAAAMGPRHFVDVDDPAPAGPADRGGDRTESVHVLGVAGE